MYKYVVFLFLSLVFVYEYLCIHELYLIFPCSFTFYLFIYFGYHLDFSKFLSETLRITVPLSRLSSHPGGESS